MTEGRDLNGGGLMISVIFWRLRCFGAFFFICILMAGWWPSRCHVCEDLTPKCMERRFWESLTSRCNTDVRDENMSIFQDGTSIALPSPDPDQSLDTLLTTLPNLTVAPTVEKPFHKPVFMVKSFYRGTLTSRYREVLCSFGCGLLAFALEMMG
jgi:hypothetical protein